MSISNVSVDVVQLSGETTTVSEDALAQLRASMKGPVLIEDDPGYHEARVIFNRMFEGYRPAIIARCAGTSDVVKVVNFAREHALLTAIRGGGHGIPGFALADRGLVIDLTLMRAVLVDGEQKIARVQGGATLNDLDRETERSGLIVPAGVVSDTGVAGLTLGGGLGWVHRKFGLSIDSLREVEIATADGSILRANAKQHKDLFWALQGGGGNFGVVTEFVFEAHELGPLVRLGFTAYPLEDARGILPQWRSWTEKIPNEVTSRVIMFTPPDHPSTPPELLGNPAMIIGAVYAGPVEDADEHIAPIGTWGTPLVELGGPITWTGLQTMLDLARHFQFGGYWKSAYLHSMPDEFFDIVERRATTRPTPQTVSQLITMGGQVSKRKHTDSAFGFRDAPYMLSAEAVWEDDQFAEPCTTWAQEFVAEAEGLGISAGTYLNFSGESDETSRKLQYGENLDRLVKVKREYDPTNLFRRNNNIPPD
jgi:FAD/FMN-containing dehydrogenase